MFFEKKVQKVTMGFYREERVPNHSRFDLAYSCVGRYVGWTKLHSHVFGLIPSLERVHTFISISKKFKLRAPAVHGVSSYLTPNSREDIVLRKCRGKSIFVV